MASLDFENEKSIFIQYYDENSRKLIAASNLFSGLISALLVSIEDIELPSVSSRVKDKNECLKKFIRKYQSKLEEDQTLYEIKDHISDLIGLRVVCYYAEDIPKVVKLIRGEFQIVGETDKSAELESKEDSFGYKGHHLNIKINSSRTTLPEYNIYSDMQFEIQVRSTVQDAWSVLDHKIKGAGLDKVTV